jgi:sulfur carrier protein
MTVVVNGEVRELRDGATVIDLLNDMQLTVRGRGIAVARNGDIVLHSEWSDTTLAPDDHVEVLHAVQGG